MIILGIDPGPRESAYVRLDGGTILAHDYLPNDELRAILRWNPRCYDVMVIEWIEGYGLTVGRETFETCLWVGRFIEVSGHDVRLGRKAIKSHLCNTTQAKDKDVREAVMDKFGGRDSIKKGGPLHGITSHLWAALACAITYRDQIQVVVGKT
jgi:hypothetical protein